MQDRRRKSWKQLTFVLLSFAALVGWSSVWISGCDRSVSVAKTVRPSPTPVDLHEQSLIDRAVRDKLADDDRHTEQQLTNARAAAAQRMVGVQMFRDLEMQYRQRRETQDKDPTTPAPDH